jgi:hypothetical protein
LGPKIDRSTGASGTGGLAKPPIVPASACRSSDTFPWRAVTTAKEPGIPPEARTSALFWNINR